MEYELYHYGVKGMKWGKRKQRDNDSTVTRTNAKTAPGAKKPSISKKKASAGKKKAQKIIQSGAKATAKTVGYGAQVAARMIQNAMVYNALDATYKSVYRNY